MDNSQPEQIYNWTEAETIERLREVIKGQGLSMAAISKELTDLHNKNSLLHREHSTMLNELKGLFSFSGETYLWNIIHAIDPEWPNPWRRDDSECLCELNIPEDDRHINLLCPVHGDPYLGDPGD